MAEAAELLSEFGGTPVSFHEESWRRLRLSALRGGTAVSAARPTDASCCEPGRGFAAATRSARLERFSWTSQLQLEGSRHPDT